MMKYKNRVWEMPFAAAAKRGGLQKNAIFSGMVHKMSDRGHYNMKIGTGKDFSPRTIIEKGKNERI